MPLPLIIGAVIAGAAGVGSGIRGGMKMKEANDTIEVAKIKHEENLVRIKEQSETTSLKMDNVGKKELEILSGFDEFSQLFEKIHNKPEFKSVNKDGVVLPVYNQKELQDVAVGAGIIFGTLGGAVAGTAGGFAAAGATTAAVMALGTASTGTAIGTLSGVAATNATLAALGGGAVAAGGGGMALGSAVLGGATLGVGLLVGGIIFNATGSSLSKKADEAWDEMRKTEKQIDKICIYLEELLEAASKFLRTLKEVNTIYTSHFERLQTIVEVDGKTDWNIFTKEEKLITENIVLLVGVLFNMCKVQLVEASENEADINKVNSKEIDQSIKDANEVLLNIPSA